MCCQQQWNMKEPEQAQNLHGNGHLNVDQR